MPLACATSTPSTPAPRPPLPVLSASAPAAVSTVPLPRTTFIASNTSPTFGSASSIVSHPDPPSPSMSVASVAPPSATWTSRFFIDLEGGAPGLTPSLSPGYTRCTSEPPAAQPEMVVRHQRSRSASRTPSLPRSGDSRTDLKSLPVTPKVTTPATTFIEPAADGDLALPSGPTSPFQPPLATSALERGRSLKRPAISHNLSHDALELKNTTPRPPLPHMSDSNPVTPDERSEQDIERSLRPHVHTRSYGSYSYGSFGADAAALRSTQYTDLFLLEPHEYDSITDGELVRLFDRGVIDGRVLEQIVDASIRIQRACTDADRAVSIKTRRAMIRHALED